MLFGLTFGVAVGLGRTPPPPLPIGVPSISDVKIGYDFDGPLTLVRVLVDWRFDLIFGSAAIILAALYVAGVLRLRRRGDAWPSGPDRGLVAGLPGAVVRQLVRDGSLHAGDVQHAHGGPHDALSMLVPILLVLGGPVGLALRALPAAGRGDPPGMREWVLAALHSKVSKVLTNPLVATALFVAGFYGLYLGGLFDAAVGSHIGHVIMNVHFLASGYLFYWVVIGVDPTPRPIPPLAKVAVVFASLPLHAFFAIILMSMHKGARRKLLPIAAPELAHRPDG